MASNGATTFQSDLRKHRITLPLDHVHRNLAVPAYVEHALSHEKDSHLTSTGALSTTSYDKTGRSPNDKRIVEDDATRNEVWWGSVNTTLPPSSFCILRQRAVDFLNTCPDLYVFDGFACWDPKFRIKIRVICTRPYHAFFMHCMLIRPTLEELANFGTPDWVIYNAGEFPADPNIPGVTSETSVAIDLTRQEMVILGTQYAGEMKKGVFTILNYLAPKQGALSLHSSANEGPDGTTTVFFGLSGTGKTTLSADPRRLLIGDDEHIWTDQGIFNIEGGCYAKCINLKEENEPDIFRAIKFGAVLENVVTDPLTRIVDYTNTSLTENTRCAYPLEHITHVKLPAMGTHPTNVILLTCDAFGVLPPVSLLTNEQAMYHFISGYTAKVAGTEMGVSEPQATFSACFGGPFLVWHPAVYARLLAEKLVKHSCRAWLINTGWSGGPYGVGKRISLKYTRAMIDAIHSGDLAKTSFTPSPIFGLQIPASCPGVPSEILNPELTWANKEAFRATLTKLAAMFIENFKEYESKTDEMVKKAGPRIENGEVLKVSISKVL